ncbi:MAG: helix-turn-helix domain-containing protein [Alphaproteobacteria bacterium]|nr:helix-turn-helix domain-containing protein [Alphaproteobacteria bacterium]
MEKVILERLTVLGHPRRIAVFRLLMRRYPDAVPAGEIARALAIKSSTLSVYLGALTSAGLLQKTRHATSLHYQVRLAAARELMDFLFLDCCRGRAQLCPQLELSTLAPKGGPGRPEQNVIFICTGNSARSILAESILRHTAGTRFNAFSAGTRPAGAPNRLAIKLLQEHGHDISALRSKSLDGFLGQDAPHMDFIFTVCDSAANEECPLWPGQPISGHWGIPDPAITTGSAEKKMQAFRRAYGQMQARIDAFIDLSTAGFDEGFDPVNLQSQIDMIGKMPSKYQE